MMMYVCMIDGEQAKPMLRLTGENTCSCHGIPLAIQYSLGPGGHRWSDWLTSLLILVAVFGLILARI
jgi:hypothetical protein